MEAGHPSASGLTVSRPCVDCGSRRGTASWAWTPSSIPRRGGSADWAVKMDKADFSQGRAGAHRGLANHADSSDSPGRRRTDQGMPIWSGGSVVGHVDVELHVASARPGRDAGMAEAHALPRDGRDRGRTARITTPLLRPAGRPCPLCEPLTGWRVVADPSALDHLAWSSPSMPASLTRGCATRAR